jgi:hypothetical protein
VSRRGAIECVAATEFVEALLADGAVLENGRIGKHTSAKIRELLDFTDESVVEELKQCIAELEAAREQGSCELQNDAMTMALRLLGEDESTFSPESIQVMKRWRPKALKFIEKRGKTDLKQEAVNFVEDYFGEGLMCADCPYSAHESDTNASWCEILEKGDAYDCPAVPDKLYPSAKEQG